MRFEDGIFGEYKLITGPTTVEQTLQINDESFVARSADCDLDAYASDGSLDPNYKPDGGTVYNMNGEIAKPGDTCPQYPHMYGRAVKIYTNNCDKNVRLRPLSGRDTGEDDIVIKLFPGMMLPFACKGIEVPSGSAIVILA